MAGPIARRTDSSSRSGCRWSWSPSPCSASCSGSHWRRGWSVAADARTIAMIFRTHPLTGEPILFAPNRAARPRAFGDPSSERCPFCPGHESDTPAEVARIGDPWRVRVFPNKYPPVDGAEVIVEAPGHDDPFHSIEHG